ncbi:unnamed protein product [Phytomonas sp. Hart1]|nr:unnamed protein product [Phytomonas sp. Hart1]|eukprot:CCW69131.1 unnamed protein product [Phytomonas sp. isolate Hart1]
MTIDTFTLEIIAESGRRPDCVYAEKILPLRTDAHKTLCTLIISNMLCNVLVVQEFRAIIAAGAGPSPHLAASAEEYWTRLWEFAGSTFLVVVTEIVPMSICKSKYSLRVAAWGAIFVQFAMILTYPVSMPLGKFLDWVVGGKERGQIYDRNELRRLMVLQYERKGNNKGGMSKAELDLLLSAMDFQESKVLDVMQPLDKITYIHKNNLVTPDFISQIWLSGRSRVPVMSEKGTFDSVLVVKDLLTANINPEGQPTRVAEIVKERNRSLVIVRSSTPLPTMLRIFQDLKTHMALVFPAKDFSSIEAATKHMDKAIGLVTMEDVVEKLLNEEIYDEYDRYGVGDASFGAITNPSSSVPMLASVLEKEPQSAPQVPAEFPRVNFYSYFTHPEAEIALTKEQVWAVAFFLHRTIPSFIMWDVGRIKLLLDDCQDQQLVPSSYFTQGVITCRSSIVGKEALEGSEIMNESLKSPNESFLSCDRRTFNSNSNLPRQTTTSHSQFLRRAEEDKFILYKKDVHSTNFTLVLGGQVELLVGDQIFSTRIYSFCHLAEEALSSSPFISDFSAIVVRPARIYSISKELYNKHASHQLTRQPMISNESINDSNRPRSLLKPFPFPTNHTLLEGSKAKKGLFSNSSGSLGNNIISDQKAYGTFNK